MADAFLDKIVAWATGEEPIRGLVLQGSKAEPGATDRLSDYDINVFVTEHAPYTDDDAWMSTIADVWVYIPEKGYHNGKQYPNRLVIFRGGVKVDFSFLPATALEDFAESDPLPDFYDCGYQLLLDKDAVAKSMCPPSFTAYRRGKPTSQEFRECVCEFWFEAYHIAKYLWRDDLWIAKFRDWTTKEQLMKMIQWSERGKHAWDLKTHPLGKQMKSWVCPKTWESLHRCFGRFDREDAWRAMFATLELFGRVARETAQLLGCEYPAEIEDNIVSFAKELRKDAAQQ